MNRVFARICAVALASLSLIAKSEETEVYFYRMSSLSTDRDKPGCYMTFTDQEGVKFPRGGSQIRHSNDVPCIVFRNDEEIGRLGTNPVKNEFTDYDVVPGETYTYEIRGYDGEYSATTGKRSITCYFIYIVEIETQMVTFGASDSMWKAISYSLYKQTANGKTPISGRVSYNCDDDWINVDVTEGIINIGVDENNTGSAREGVVTILYPAGGGEGFKWQIKVTQAGNATGNWMLKYHSNNGKNDLGSQSFKVGEEKRLYYMNSRLGWEYKDEDGFNYVFLGWAKSPTGAVAYENGALVKDLVAKGKTMHIYAVWQKRAYEVCFHSNDEDALVEYQEFRPNIAKNLLWLDSGLGWTREGYDFLGWAKAPTSTAVVYANGETVKNLVEQGQTLHLYAVWRDRRWTIRYHRNYNSGDSTYEDQKIPVGASVKLRYLDSQLGWTRNGYWFKGWAKSRTAGAAYANGETVKDLVPGGQVLHLYGAWGQKTK